MIDALVQGMQAQWHRHEVLANNLANVSTSGFKRDDLLILPAGTPAPSGTVALPTGGQATVTPWTDFSQGPIRQTGRDLDVALQGPGFLVVETSAGERYTRAGALDVSPAGFLVTSTGLNVLGQKGPIAVRSGGVSIDFQGEVQDGGRTVDTLRIVEFPSTAQLLKEGGGLLAATDPGAATPATSAQVISGSLEGANVNSVEAMVNIIEVLRTYESYQRAIQAIDEVDRLAANDLGRV
jgi:flagellar basal-body rod protein FlgF